MTRDELRFYFAGRFVLNASRNAPLNYGLLESYIAGALAAYDFLRKETGLDSAITNAPQAERDYITRNLEGKPK